MCKSKARGSKPQGQLVQGAKVKVMRDRQLVDRAQADQAAAISDRAFNEARTAERAEVHFACCINRHIIRSHASGYTRLEESSLPVANFFR